MFTERLDTKIGRWTLLLGLSLAANACSSDEATAPKKSTGTDQDEAEADDETDEADDDKADAEDDEPKGGTTTKDASTGGKIDAGTGGKIDGGVKETSSKSDASGGGSSADSGSTSTDKGGSDAAVPTGNLTLPDPSERGPYEVVTENNVGKGFELPINTNDMGTGGGFCDLFVQLFDSDPEKAAEFARIPPDTNMALYSLYRPKDFVEGKRYPVLSWGNGTCALPYGYGGVLTHLASHGFIVIAAHSRFVGDGKAQLKGIDFILAADKDAASPLFGHVDAERIGVFGHSQGAGGTAAASKDSRVDTAAPLNTVGGGGFPRSVFFLTGEQDLMPASSSSGYDAASGPAAFINLKMSDHITLIEEPVRVYPAVTAWFRYQLLADDAGKAYFVGSDCKLCNQAAKWTFKQKKLM